MCTETVTQYTCKKCAYPHKKTTDHEICAKVREGKGKFKVIGSCGKTDHVQKSNKTELCPLCRLAKEQKDKGGS